MAIDKLTPKYLKKDEDYRIIKAIEMIDALNVRVSADEEGNEGVLKNIKGNTEIDIVLPIGSNKTIGSVHSDKTKDIFFFVFNTSGHHGIYRYNLSKQSVDVVYQDSILNFKKNSFVKADVVYNGNDEVLLYFTDGINPPRKINASKALKSTSYPSSISQSIKNVELDVCKQPPLEPITFTYQTDSTLSSNFINDKLFQFAYQYVYADGEVSAISAYSKLAINPNNVFDSFITEEERNSSNNAIKLEYANSESPEVEEIRLLKRNGSSGSFELIEKVVNNPNLATSNFVFLNDRLYSSISDDEFFKMYDNVPQTAYAQTVSNNRLFYGDYTEGYSNVDTDVDISVNYEEGIDVYNINVAITNYTPSYYPWNIAFDIDLSKIPSVIQKDNTKVNVNMLIDIDYIRNTYSTVFLYDWTEKTNAGGPDAKSGQLWLHSKLTPTKINESFTVNSGTTIQDISDEIQLRIEKQYNVLLNNDSRNPADASFVNRPLYQDRLIWFTGSAITEIYDYSFDSVTNIASARWFVNTVSANIKRVVKLTNHASISTVQALEPVNKKILYDNNFSAEMEIYSGPINSADGSIIAHYYGNLTGEIHAPSITNASYVSVLGVDNISTFKSDAQHEFGIVYYDNRNRSGGVNKIGSVYVEPFGRRGNGLNGRSYVDIDIKHSAPSWATKYQIVYSGNKDSEEVHQYTVIDSFVARRTPKGNGSNVDSFISGSTGNRIYLSMRGLEGKPDSYKSSYSIKNLDYSFTKGDTVRIVKYYDDSSRDYVYPSSDIVFKVVDYQYFDFDGSPLDITDSVISNFSAYATTPEAEQYRITGWFLAIEGLSDVDGFGFEDVLYGRDNFYKNCLIEIRKPKAQSSNPVYYEISEIGNVNGTSHSPSSLTITTGDCYLKRRRLRVNNIVEENGDVYVLKSEIASTSYKVDFVEDFSVSDFFSSSHNHFGRPNAFLEDDGTKNRFSSITYSEPYLLDSGRLNLSNFNPSKGNWKDYPAKYGGFTYLVDRDTAILGIQENKVSITPVSRNIIQFADGDTAVTTTNQVLGNEQYFAGEYGANRNPESVIDFDGMTVFADVRRNKILAAGQQGVTMLSDNGLSSFWRKNLESLQKKAGSVKVYGGYDPDNNEVIFTVEPLYITSVTINDVAFELPTVDGESSAYEGGLVYSNANIPLWNTENRDWDVVCDIWDAHGNGVIFLDNLGETLSIYMNPSLQGQSGVVDVLITNTQQTFYAVGQIDLSTGEFTLPATDCSGALIEFAPAPEKVVEEFTVAYNMDGNVWTSFYSYIPEMYGRLHSNLFTFKDGKIYLHESNDIRNRFYGDDYTSKITVVSNREPSTVKVYDAISIEGTDSWSTTIKTQNQETHFSYSYYKEMENEFFSHITRDELNSKSNWISIGEVVDINGSEVKFDSQIAYIPYSIGSSLYKIDSGNHVALSATIGAATSSRACIVNGASNLSVGDFIVSKGASLTEGDPMRGGFAVIELVNSSQDAVELYAINAVITDSKLHNDK
jgi:hypothetical protein